MAIKFKSMGQAAVELLHEMGRESVQDGLFAQGYIDALASTLEESNRFEEAQIVRDLAALPYSEGRHTVLMTIDSAARLELSQDKAICQFNSTLLTLRGETDIEKVLASLIPAADNLARKTQEALEGLRVGTGYEA